MRQLVSSAKVRGNFECLSTEKRPQMKRPVSGNHTREKARNAAISWTIMMDGLYHLSSGLDRQPVLFVLSCNLPDKSGQGWEAKWLTSQPKRTNWRLRRVAACQRCCLRYLCNRPASRLR